MNQDEVHLEAQASGDARIYQAGRDQHIHYADGAHQRRRAVPGAANDHECPYPGLQAFEFEDARWFYGRDDLVADLVALLDRRSRAGGIQVVLAPSGAGKTSLLRAGLLPRLASRWSHLYFTPTAEPMRVRDDLSRLLASRTGQDRVVVIVDQFEELFTLCTDDTRRREFVQMLARMAEAPSEALVVIGVRIDFVAACVDYPELRAALQDAPLVVGPMSQPQLREAILFPARDIGLDVEPGLAELLLRDLGSATASRLPLLAHALRACWLQRDGSTLTVQGYLDTGGIQNALSRTAERVYAGLSADEQRTARSMFLRMVQIGESTEDTRRRVAHTELAQSVRVVEAFARERLLALHEDTVEITHEALLRGWPRLREWIEADRAGLLIAQRLNDAAEAWVREKRDPAGLYSGNRLSAVRDHDRHLTPTGHEFLRASVAQERVRRVRRRATQILAVLIVFVAGYAWQQQGIADLQRQLADERAANLLASESRTATLEQRDPQRALLLALAAIDVRTTAATRTALYDALESQPHLSRILTGHTADKVFSNPSSGISQLLYHPRSGELFSSGADGRIIRWDPATGRRHLLGLAQYLYRGGVTRMAMSRDGTRLASAGIGPTAVWDLSTGVPSFGSETGLGQRQIALDAQGRLLTMTCVASGCNSTGVTFTLRDPASWQVASTFRYDRYLPAVALSGTTLAGGGCLTKDQNSPCSQGFIQIWDAATGQPKGEPILVPGKDIVCLDLSPDGTRIAAGTRDGDIQVWDVAARRMTHSVHGHTLMLRAIRFSPDGRLIATAGQDGVAAVWDAADVGSRRQAFSMNSSPVTAVAFSPDGRQLAAGNEFNTIMLWSLSSDTHTRSSFVRMDTEPSNVAVSPDGKLIVLGDGNGVITVLNRDTRAVITRFAVAPICPVNLIEFSGPYYPCLIKVLAFSPNGDTLLAAASEGNIFRWDTRTWSSLGDPLGADVPCRSLICDGHAVGGEDLAVAVSADLSTAATGRSGRIQVWDLKGGKLRHTLTGHDGDVDGLAFRSDGRLLASGGEDKTILLWDLRDGRRIGKPMRHDGAVKALSFHPGQHRLASNGADNTVRLWDADTQQQIGSFPNDSFTINPRLVFSSDGRYIATTTTNLQLAVRDTATLTAFPRLRDPQSIMALTFDPARGELLSVARASADNVPTYFTAHTVDPDEWKRRACRIVPRNPDHRTIEAYTLKNTKVCPDLPVDASVVMQRLEIAQTRLNERNTTGAASAYREATRLSISDSNDDAELANLVCVHGTVSLHARDVMPACDHAVAQSQGFGPFRSSRAVTRTLTGDRAGAVEDLESFVEWADRFGARGLEPNAVPQRRAWITEVRGNRDPFTAEVLKAVWKEFLTLYGGNTYQTCPVSLGGPWVVWVQRPTGC